MKFAKTGIIALLSLCVVLSLSASAATEARLFVPVQDGFALQASTQLPYVDGSVLVKFTPQAMSQSRLAIPFEKGATVPGLATGWKSVDALAQAAGATLLERPFIRPQNLDKAGALGTDRWFRYQVAKGDMEELAARFAADPLVEVAQPEWLAFPAAVPNDPLYADHWGHNNTAQMISYDWSSNSHTGPLVGEIGFDANAETAWNTTYGSSGVTIAIIDSGVDIYHEDLNCTTGYDFGNNDTNPMDDSRTAGHGTCCAGVTAAVANNGTGVTGIAGNCTIMPLKVADRRGTMSFVSITNALYYAGDNGADIVSMSLGAAISTDAATDAAILYAYNAGCTILAATGNENNSVISYPAINQYVIGVGAASPCGERKRSSSSSLEVNPGVLTDPNGYTCDGERWWGSNYGTTTQDDRGAVDVIAPTILPTTDISGSAGYDAGNYDMFFNGTSCATPYAAGVAALIKSAFPDYTPAQVRQQLCGTAQDVISVESGAGWDRYTGYGMVDAAAAVSGGGTVLNPPVAEFTGTPTSGETPLAVQFVDFSSGDPSSWSWTFGDGGTSTAQNPGHTYTAAGSYTVSLTASNGDGSDTETKTGYITVTDPVQPTPPVADFSGTPVSGDFPLAVQFTDLSANGPTSWSWTFGDGGTSTVQNPGHTYTAAGTYTVSLAVSNVYGSDTETKTGYITVTEPSTGGDTMHVAAISVYTVLSGRKYYGRAQITVVDDGGAPVSGATVTGNMTGDTNETLTGVTGTDGVATVTTARKTYATTDFCFTVTAVTHATLSYDAGANVVTQACEGGNIYGANEGRVVRAGNSLFQNAPNPFNPITEIAFSLQGESPVRLTIYDVKGQVVEVLVQETLGAGLHVQTWDARDHASGVYFYRLETGGFTETRKMIMLK
jgi:PKD repeat protein|nr:S8 family serine peptidase [Candidatus Krumholzibacteria bacterium]